MNSTSGHVYRFEAETQLNLVSSLCLYTTRVREKLCCSVLQCVAVYCSVLQCVAVCCSVLQRVAACCNVLQCVALCCSVLQCVAVCCSVWSLHERRPE